MFFVSDGFLNKRVKVDGTYKYSGIHYETFIGSVEADLRAGKPERAFMRLGLN